MARLYSARWPHTERQFQAFPQQTSETIPTQFSNSVKPPARVDILQQIDGVEFEPAWSRRTEASVEDLIRNKLQSGRMRDLADVEAIREAQNETGSSNN